MKNRETKKTTKAEAKFETDRERERERERQFKLVRKCLSHRQR